MPTETQLSAKSPDASFTLEFDSGVWKWKVVEGQVPEALGRLIWSQTRLSSRTYSPSDGAPPGDALPDLLSTLKASGYEVELTPPDMEKDKVY